ncbi:MAG: sulfite exporter TauE/SafE family protein [Eubacteriales bacterium]|nr:sulfite exporter TauE/SafE family protein [Eubacteriales bacterium]
MANNRKQIKLFIGGMTCVQCENRIQRRLRGTKGVITASVSYRSGTADIVYDGQKLTQEDIIRVIESLDYTVQSQKGTKNFRRSAGILLLIGCLFGLMERFGILNLLVPSQLAESGMGYGMLFLVGILTSVHCLAMCGGINLSQSLPREKETGNRFRPAMAYNLGRILSYTVIGAALGLVGFLLGGGEFGVSPVLQGSLKLIAGGCMVIMGINLLGLFPGLRTLTIRLPRFVTRTLGTKAAKTTNPFLIGLLNGFMPCGPLQSMQIVALASGSPLTGGLSMLAFGLGTLPLMLGFGSLVAALGKRFFRAVNAVGAVLVTVLGLAMLSQGASLTGVISSSLLFGILGLLFALAMIGSFPFSSKAKAITGTTVALAAALCLFLGNPFSSEEIGVVQDSTIQVIQSTLSSGRYPNITVQAGQPVQWIIDAPKSSINGCNYRMYVPEYGIMHTFQEGENILEFTPTETGTYAYSCWMGMIRGSITVTDAQGDA